MNRLYNLDYLRGTAAFSIMIYHYLSWTFGLFSAESVFGRVGVYGVSIFYVLSGLTLYFVYYDKMKLSKEDIVSFFKKRIYRIFPLLWLVTIASIILSQKIPDLLNLFLNLSGLFGFVKWDTYFSSGVWSIGNELVFYVFFPLFVFFTKSFKLLMVLLGFIVFCLYLYFAFIKLDPLLDLAEQWKNYVNPLNQLFLFFGGFIVGFVFDKLLLKNSILIMFFVVGVGLFVFYPVSGNLINLVTGVNRLIFTTSCFLICVSIYKLNFKIPSFIHHPLTLLGEASYSVYLLHPLVYKVTSYLLYKTEEDSFQISDNIRVLFSVVLTLLVSYFVYQYFEKYFTRLGRKRN